MTWRLLAVVFVAACGDRTREAAEARQSRDSVLSGEVIKALAAPYAPGRLIYDVPVVLSYDSLLVKRPDLAAARDRPAR